MPTPPFKKRRFTSDGVASTYRMHRVTQDLARRALTSMLLWGETVAAEWLAIKLKWWVPCDSDSVMPSPLRSHRKGMKGMKHEIPMCVSRFVARYFNWVPLSFSGGK
jgi:hypothetical protein